MEDATVFYGGVARSPDIFWLSAFHIGFLMIRILLLKHQLTF